MRTAFASMASNTGSRSPGELEMTLSTSEVAVCWSRASERCPRASTSSRVRASSCFFNSISELGPLLTRALAFVPVERRLRPRVGLFAPLRAKVTSSAQSLRLPILTHDELASSLDHLVGARQERLRDRQAERLSGGEIDDKIKLGRLLDRDVTRLRAAQNLVDIIGGASILVRDAWSIGHQTSRFDVLPQTVHRRQSRAQRQGADANAVGVHKRVGEDKKRLRAALERLERGRNILRSPDFRCGDIEAERGGRYLNLAHR